LVGIVLALLLGGLGAHRFYMNQIGWGLLYLAFCWTLIPMLVALVEAFLMSSRVGRYNRAVAARITGSLARAA
jgi:TM2 domain-containing membrane protein YozV